MPEDRNKFDQDIRSMMEKAQEEAPSRVWETVSGKLDNLAAIKAGRGTKIWKRIVSYAAIAAAVVLLSVLGLPFIRNHKASETIPAATASMPSALRPDTETDIQAVRAAEASKADYVAMSESAKANKSETVATSDTSEMADMADIADSATSVSVENTQSTAVQSKVRKEAENKEIEQNIQDPFAQMEYEDGQKAGRPKVAFIVNGQMESNGDPSKNSNLGPLRINNPSAPTKTTLTELSESTFGVPLSFGIGARMRINRSLAIGAGINYSLLSRTFTGTYTKVDDRDVIVRTITADVRNQQHFIGIPVNIFYGIIDKDCINLYAFCGGSVEKCFLDRNLIQSKPDNIRFNESVKGVQLSAAAGLGVQFKLMDGLSLYIDPSLRYYFDCNQPKSIRTQQPLMIDFEAGLRIDL